MRLSQPKLPLASIYLNLLQTRPVAPAAPAGAAPPRVVAAAAAPPAAPAPGRLSPRDLPRGSLLDILA